MSSKKAKKSPAVQLNKSMPTLPEQTDFYDLFGVSNKNTEQNFQDIIEENLASDQIAAALKEKNATAKNTLVTGKQTRKHPPPQSVLDLHGYTAKEAEGKTYYFIQAAAQKGLQSLLIITGKGLHSGGESVLRDVVETVLIELKKQNVIISFKWEKKHKHKSGAMFVYLD